MNCVAMCFIARKHRAGYMKHHWLVDAGAAKNSATGKLRLVSLLPSATEMACALGLTDQLLGITHCCDYPPEIRGKPLVVHSNIPVSELSLREIDSAVSETLGQGASLYHLDEQLL